MQDLRFVGRAPWSEFKELGARGLGFGSLGFRIWG